MPNNAQLRGIPFNATATGTTGATANVVVGATQTAYITDMSATGDTNGAVVTIRDNTTAKWQLDLGITSPLIVGLQTPMGMSMGNTLTVVVSGTTGKAKVNVSGYYINVS